MYLAEFFKPIDSTISEAPSKFAQKILKNKNNNNKINKIADQVPDNLEQKNNKHSKIAGVAGKLSSLSLLGYGASHAGSFLKAFHSGYKGGALPEPMSFKDKMNNVLSSPAFNGVPKEKKAQIFQIIKKSQKFNNKEQTIAPVNNKIAIDKIDKSQTPNQDAQKSPVETINKQVVSDVYQALTALGYKKTNAKEMVKLGVDKYPKSTQSFDDLLSLILKDVSSIPTIKEPGIKESFNFYKNILTEDPNYTPEDYRAEYNGDNGGENPTPELMKDAARNYAAEHNIHIGDTVQITKGNKVYKNAIGKLLKFSENGKAILELDNCPVKSCGPIHVKVSAIKLIKRYSNPEKTLNTIVNQTESDMNKYTKTIGESLLKLRAKKFIAEGEMENAEAALAAKDLVDRLQDTIEDIGKMSNEELPHLVDAIRNSFGQDKASAYQSAANEVLTGLLDVVKEKKTSLENATLSLTGDAPAESGDELGLPDGEEGAGDLDDLAGDSEIDDNEAGDAADDVDATPKKNPLGREFRPEAGNESRVNRGKKLAESKKKTGKKPEWLTKAEEKAEKKEEKKVPGKKNVAEAAIRKALSKACPDCKAKSGEKCKHLKQLKESSSYGGLHIARWKAILSEAKTDKQKATAKKESDKRIEANKLEIASRDKIAAKKKADTVKKVAVKKTAAKKKAEKK